MKRLKITLHIGRVRDEKYLDLGEEVRNWNKQELDLLRSKIEEIIKEKADEVLKSGNYTHFAEVLAKIVILLAIEEIKHIREIDG